MKFCQRVARGIPVREKYEILDLGGIVIQDLPGALLLYTRTLICRTDGA